MKYLKAQSSVIIRDGGSVLAARDFYAGPRRVEPQAESENRSKGPLNKSRDDNTWRLGLELIAVK